MMVMHVRALFECEWLRVWASFACEKSRLIHVLRVLQDLLQRTQYPLERRAVHREAGDGLGGRLDIRLALVVW